MAMPAHFAAAMLVPGIIVRRSKSQCNICEMSGMIGICCVTSVTTHVSNGRLIGSGGKPGSSDTVFMEGGYETSWDVLDARCIY